MAVEYLINIYQIFCIYHSSPSHILMLHFQTSMILILEIYFSIIFLILTQTMFNSNKAPIMCDIKCVHYHHCGWYAGNQYDNIVPVISEGRHWILSARARVGVSHLLNVKGCTILCNFSIFMTE